MDLEDIRRYLPTYLSPEAQDRLFSELKQFPDNVDQRMYSTGGIDNETVFQGDGIRELPQIFLPDDRIEPKPALVLSNTCDIDLRNRRSIPPRIVYCPIINLEKFRTRLLGTDYFDSEEKVDEYIGVIRRQEVSTIFFLPAYQNMEDSLALLDGINSCRRDVIDDNQIQAFRLFTLSNYGFYLFLYKLSIHFTRIREGVERG